jgi:hypothetical protein
MSDVRDLLETGVGDYAPPQGGLDRTQTKMKRRQRGRTIATIGLALVIGLAGVGVVLAAFGRSGTQAVTPPPTAQRAVVMQMRPVEAVVVPTYSRYPTLTPTCRFGRRCTSRQLLTQKTVVLLDPSGDKYRLGPVILSGADVVSASAVDTGGGGARAWVVAIRLSPNGTAAFAQATAISVRNAPPRNEIAIVVEGRVWSSPAVQSRISSGTGQITGLTRTQARQLAAEISGG